MKNNNLICRKTKSTFRKKSYGKINSLYVSQKSIFMHFRTKSRSNFKFSSKFPRHSKQNRIKTKLVTKKFDAIEKQYKHTQTIKFYDLCKFLSISPFLLVGSYAKHFEGKIYIQIQQRTFFGYKVP